MRTVPDGGFPSPVFGSNSAYSFHDVMPLMANTCRVLAGSHEVFVPGLFLPELPYFYGPPAARGYRKCLASIPYGNTFGTTAFQANDDPVTLVELEACVEEIEAFLNRTRTPHLFSTRTPFRNNLLSFVSGGIRSPVVEVLFHLPEVIPVLQILILFVFPLSFE